MGIHIICDRATPEQMAEMQQMLHTYIKLAVDVERKILAGGGEMMLIAKTLCWTMRANKRISGEQTGIHQHRK